MLNQDQKEDFLNQVELDNLNQIRHYLTHFDLDKKLIEKALLSIIYNQCSLTCLKLFIDNNLFFDIYCPVSGHCLTSLAIQNDFPDDFIITLIKNSNIFFNKKRNISSLDLALNKSYSDQVLLNLLEKNVEIKDQINIPLDILKRFKVLFIKYQSLKNLELV